jgi:hypothetical protein
MFEVMLGSVMFVFLTIEVYLLYLVKNFEQNDDLGPLLERIEGKLVLTLEAIDEAVAEIEPPTVAESLAQVASMYFQGRMMDKMGIAADPQLHNTDPAPPEVWPVAEPPKRQDAEA